MTASTLVPRFADALGDAHDAGDVRRRLRVACVQLASGSDGADNLRNARIGLLEAAHRGAELVVLPEKWNLIGDAPVLAHGAESLDGPAVSMVRELCREHSMWCVAGSIAERRVGHDRLVNTSVVIDPEGEIRAAYRKLHMFDVDVAGVRYRESDAEDAGDEIVTCDVAGVPLGLSICYDLRFPELFRILALRGARIITVPAAFTVHTGRDHWEVLLRARAIENQCFIIACGVIGDHGDGKVSYGRSMVIDPWGIVLAQAPDAESVIVADLDLASLDRVRSAIPALSTRRDDVYDWPLRTPSIT